MASSKIERRFTSLEQRFTAFEQRLATIETILDEAMTGDDDDDAETPAPTDSTSDDKSKIPDLAPDVIFEHHPVDAAEVPDAAGPEPLNEAPDGPGDSTGEAT